MMQFTVSAVTMATDQQQNNHRRDHPRLPAVAGPPSLIALLNTSGHRQSRDVEGTRHESTNQAHVPRPLFSEPVPLPLNVVTSGNIRRYRGPRKSFDCATATQKYIGRTRTQQINNSPLNTFLHVWDDEITSKIIELSIKSVNRRKPPRRRPRTNASRSCSAMLRPFTRTELLRYFGIRILLGQVRIKKEKDIWGNDDDFTSIKNILNTIREALPLKRYQSIRQNICCSRDDAEMPDARIDWVIDAVFSNALQMYRPSSDLTLDDQSFRFYGRCKYRRGPRGRRKGKADKCALEFHSLNDKSGFTTCMRMMRKEKIDANRSESQSRSASNIIPRFTHQQIIEMIEQALPDPRGFHITMDRGYTSYALFLHLQRIGVLATGCIKENWTIKHSSFTHQPETTVEGKSYGVHIKILQKMATGAIYVTELGLCVVFGCNLSVPYTIAFPL